MPLASITATTLDVRPCHGRILITATYYGARVSSVVDWIEDIGPRIRELLESLVAANPDPYGVRAPG